MLIVCPNCASSYGVDMASLRPARGRARQVRCSRCRFVWPAELSYAEKLMVAADGVVPVRRAMLAAAQAAAEAARSSLPRLRRPTTILADELASAQDGQLAVSAPRSGPVSGAKSTPRPHATPPLAKRASAALSAGSSRLANGIAGSGIAVVAGVNREVSRLSRWLSWRPTWRPSCRLSWRLSWPLSRHSFRPPSLSHLHYLVVALALVDAAVIGWRVDVVWAMPQTAKFYAALGLPVSVRGVQFDRLTAAAEERDGGPVLVVKGEIGNSTDRPEAVPHLRFAILNSQRQEIYSWTAAPARGRRLPAGETLPFQSELTLPPPDTRAVAVRFIDPDNSF